MVNHGKSSRYTRPIFHGYIWLCWIARGWPWMWEDFHSQPSHHDLWWLVCWLKNCHDKDDDTQTLPGMIYSNIQYSKEETCMCIYKYIYIYIYTFIYTYYMHVDSVQSTIPVSKETRTNALTKWYQVDCKRCKNVRGIPVSLSVKVHTSNQIPMIIYI